MSFYETHRVVNAPYDFGFDDPVIDFPQQIIIKGDYDYDYDYSTVKNYGGVLDRVAVDDYPVVDDYLPTTPTDEDLYPVTKSSYKAKPIILLGLGALIIYLVCK